MGVLEKNTTEERCPGETPVRGTTLLANKTPTPSQDPASDKMERTILAWLQPRKIPAGRGAKAGVMGKDDAIHHLIPSSRILSKCVISLAEKLGRGDPSHNGVVGAVTCGASGTVCSQVLALRGGSSPACTAPDEAPTVQLHENA